MLGFTKQYTSIPFRSAKPSEYYVFKVELKNGSIIEGMCAELVASLWVFSPIDSTALLTSLCFGVTRTHSENHAASLNGHIRRRP